MPPRRQVSGNSSHLAVDIPDRVEVVGRIAPDTIWGYIRQVKKSNKVSGCSCLLDPQARPVVSERSSSCV